MTAKGVDVKTENTNNATEINAASDTDTYKCKRTNRIGYTLEVSPSLVSRWRKGYSLVSGVVEDLKFKISEGSDQFRVNATLIQKVF